MLLQRLGYEDAAIDHLDYGFCALDVGFYRKCYDFAENQLFQAYFCRKRYVECVELALGLEFPCRKAVRH